MPIGKKRNFKTKTKHSFKKTLKSKPKGAITPYKGFPPALRKYNDKLKLKYSEIVSLTTSASSSGECLFRLNSLHAPSISGSGHQPYSYDTLTTLWVRYNVRKVLIWGVVHMNTAHSGKTFYMRVGDTVTASTSKKTDNITESNECVYLKEIPPLLTAVGEGRQYKFKKWFNLDKLKNLNKNNSVYSGAFGDSGSPTDIIYLALGQCANTSSSDTMTAHVNMMFYFDVVDPVILSQS